jgi:hypothetical protein
MAELLVDCQELRLVWILIILILLLIVYCILQQQECSVECRKEMDALEKTETSAKVQLKI